MNDPNFESVSELPPLWRESWFPLRAELSGRKLMILWIESNVKDIYTSIFFLYLTLMFYISVYSQANGGRVLES